MDCKWPARMSFYYYYSFLPIQAIIIIIMPFPSFFSLLAHNVELKHVTPNPTVYYKDKAKPEDVEIDTKSTSMYFDIIEKFHKDANQRMSQIIKNKEDKIKD